MSWDWVNDYPIFVYTTFIDHYKFKVSVVRGKKGDQNAKGYGPNAKPWFTFNSINVCAHHEAVKQALNLASLKMQEEDNTNETLGVKKDLETCPNCGYCPLTQPIYHACIFTPDRKWNPVFSSINKKLVMLTGKNFAIDNHRSVKIVKDLTY